MLLKSASDSVPPQKPFLQHLPMIIAEPCPLSEAAAHHLAENRAGMPGYAARKLLASTIQDNFPGRSVGTQKQALLPKCRPDF